MYKKMIIAVDDSPTAARALEEGVALAGIHGTHVLLVHAVDEALLAHFSRTTLGDIDAVQAALIKEGEAVLAAAAEKAKALGATITCRLLVSDHLPAADQIAAAVEEEDADLLVVGSHGRRGVQRMLLGSIAEKLLRKVTISVLIVRHREGES